MIEDGTELGPSGPLLAPPAQHAEPAPRHLMGKTQQHRQVSGHGVVLVVAPEHALQPAAHLGHRIVHPAAEFLLDLSQFLPPPIPVRDAPDVKPATFGTRANMLEAQEGERLGFFLHADQKAVRAPEEEQPTAERAKKSA